MVHSEEFGLHFFLNTMGAVRECFLQTKFYLSTYISLVTRVNSILRTHTDFKFQDMSTNARHNAMHIIKNLLNISNEILSLSYLETE